MKARTVVSSTRRAVRLALRYTTAVEPLEARIAPAYTASLAGAVATFVGNAGNDTIIFTASGGLLSHNRVGDAGFNSSFDFNSSVAGDQTLSAAASSTVNINFGAGNDTAVFGTAASPASTLFADFNVTNSGSDGDELIVDDSGGSTANSIVVASNGITGTGINVSAAGSAFDGGRTLRAGTDGDTITLRSVLTAGLGDEPNFIFAGDGDDSITVGSAAGSLDGFEQSVQIDGEDGNDTLIYNDSGDADEHFYTLLGGSFTRDERLTISHNPATLEIRRLTAGSASDSIDAADAAGRALLTLNGGGGADFILGSAGNDVLIGGPGNDVLIGGDGNDSFGGLASSPMADEAGSDQFYGGAGSDAFVWDPGDGSDLIEAGEGADVLTFNGNAGAEQFTLSANSTRLSLFRAQANILMDVAGLEQVNLNAFAGTDTITVNDLTGTDVRLLRLETGLGDGNSDIVNLNGTSLPDTVQLSSPGGLILVAGLPALVEILGTTAAGDSLTVNGRGGIDTLRADAGARALASISLIGDGASLTGGQAFGAPTGYDTAKAPQALASGDVNGDSFPDLVVAGKGGVSLLLGSASGIFAPATAIATGGKNPAGIVLGRFDAGTTLDLAVTHSGSKNVAILLGAGDGTFAAPALVTVPAGPTAIRAALMNGDSFLDLVVTSTGGARVSVLANNGDGTFATPTSIATGGKAPRDLVVADFDLDGASDVAVANSGSGTVGFLRGNGDGTLQAAAVFKVGVKPTAIAAGDFDGDGALDLAAVHAVSRFASVLLGNGAAAGPRFDPALRIGLPGAKAPSALATADLDGDGALDLITTNRAAGSVSILRGLGNGTFLAPLDLDLGAVPPPQPAALLVVDANADGLLDLVTANQKTNEISVLLRLS